MQDFLPEKEKIEKPNVLNRTGFIHFRLGLTRIENTSRCNKCIECRNMFQEYCGQDFNIKLSFESIVFHEIVF